MFYTNALQLSCITDGALLFITSKSCLC